MAVGFALSACGDDDGGEAADGDKPAFCEAVLAIDTDMERVTSAEEAVAALTAHDVDLDALLANAPAAVTDDASFMVANSRKIIETGNVEAVGEDTDEFDAARARVAEFCE